MTRVLACQEEESKAGMDGRATVVLPLHHVPWICRSGIILNSFFWINDCLIPMAVVVFFIFSTLEFKYRHFVLVIIFPVSLIY